MVHRVVLIFLEVRLLVLFYSANYGLWYKSSTIVRNMPQKMLGAPRWYYHGVHKYKEYLY